MSAFWHKADIATVLNDVRRQERPPHAAPHLPQDNSQDVHVLRVVLRKVWRSMRRPFLATYIVQHGGNVRFVPKSRHSGRYWILLLVGKGTQVRGSSPVKLTRRRFLH